MKDDFPDTFGKERAIGYWNILSTMYGQVQLLKMFPNKDDCIVAWADQFRTLRQHQFATGIRKLQKLKKRIPSVPEFIELCHEEDGRQSTDKVQPLLPLPRTGWELDPIYRTEDNAEDFDERWGDRWYAHARQRLLKYIVEGKIGLRENERGVIAQTGRIGVVPDIGKRITDCFIAAAKTWADDCRTTWDRYLDTETGEIVLHKGGDAVPNKEITNKWWDDMMAGAHKQADEIRSEYYDGRMDEGQSEHPEESNSDVQGM